MIPNGAAGSPPARSGHSAVYDSVNNRLIVFGGCAGYCAPVLNDVWVLSNANGLGGTPVWTQLSPTGAPPPGRTNAVAAYGSISTFPPLTQNALLIVSGQDGSADPCSTISDMWALSNANGLDQTAPAWSNLTEPNLIGVNGAAAAFVPGSGLYLFGGMANINGVCSITNDLVEIFTPVRGPGPPGFEVFIQQATNWPAPRAFASATYDSKGGRILVFGGVDASGNYLNDLWSWSTLAPVWSMHSPVGASPAAREGQAAVFDSASQRMTIFGGSGAGGALNDTWVLHAPFVPGMACTAFGGVPNVARTEGLAEQVADLVLNCIGGTPTPEGHPIPEYYISLALNTDVTTRLLPEAKGLSEALLFIDEPYPAVPSPPPPLSPPPQPHSPPQMLCTPLGSECPETGTGGTPNPYQTQPNIFAGTQSSENTMVWKVPIDPPGPNFTRVIRITNVRSNASQLGVPRGFYPLFLTANVAIKGSNPPQFGPPQAVLAMSEEGLLASTVSSASIPQCQPHNAALLGGAGTPAFDFSVQAEEGFSCSFRYRNYGTFLSGPEFPPVLDEQNVLGYNYATETGFYSPSLLTPAPTIGLADFGTRILVSLGSVSAGTKLFVPTTITLTGSYGIGAMSGTLQLVQAGASGNSAPGYQPVASTAMLGTTPVAEANSSGSTAYAVYEVIYSDPSVQETATIPVAVAFTNTPAIGTVNANTSLAPLSMVGTASQAAPIPRFTNFSSAQPAYSIAACPPVRQ